MRQFAGFLEVKLQGLSLQRSYDAKGDQKGQKAEGPSVVIDGVFGPDVLQGFLGRLEIVLVFFHESVQISLKFCCCYLL